MRTLTRSALLFSFFFWMIAGAASSANGEPESDATKQFSLQGTWHMQSSCEDKSAPEAISAPGFADSTWHKAEVPGTVVGALVADGTLSDPNYGMNLKSYPGTNYTARVFANADMPADSPFRCSYWFRTEFTLPAEFPGADESLHFLGINYRANIWLNGKKIADRADVAGAYRFYEFRVGDLLKKGAGNALAVEIFAPEKNDLGLTWVDCNPTPPDKDMGLWREVFLTSSGEVALRAPFVSSKLDSEYKSAELTLSAELRNVTDRSVKAMLHVEIDAIKISQPVELAAKEIKVVSFTPQKFAQLKLAKPRLWWPYQMGNPNLYTAKFHVEIGNQLSDRTDVTFGIREVTSELTDKGHRLFKVNGKRVLIRGAAWAPDLLLRFSEERLDADLGYVKHMGLNTIRLEAKMDREQFFDKTDRLGLLVMPGWTCCDAWERWKNWTDETKKVAAASLVSQITRLRTHASVFVWLNGSDGPPPAEIETTYLNILKDLHWPNPSISSAAADSTTVTGKSGVKMTGPYEYVPPMYWLVDNTAGGAYGYNTETSPGPAIPPKESLQRFIPREHLWPIDEYWNYHAGGGRFTTVNVFNEGLNNRYGTATSLDDYERKAQAMTYDGQRAMFEAYGRNKYTSTGVIQWMLNNAWPSLIWHLYDYYLVPAGGYFGTKKAMEPVHVQYDYDSHSVSVVNSRQENFKSLKVSARLLNIDAKEVAAKDAVIDLPADTSVKALGLPKPENLSVTYFLKLRLQDAAGRQVSDNFYWLSTKPDTMDWAKRKGTAYTPQKEFGDLTGLNSLPQVKLEAKASARADGGDTVVPVKVRNPSAGVAFMVHLRLTQGEDGFDVVPIFWDDNYFSLLPGEERTVEARCARSSLGGKALVLEIDGYNVAPETLRP
ncbi:MAG TPA: glycoside hydrolase family 2 protein [Acidobacteriota bacterium]|nr:glycoside hydrolase family 2 protein [Acidobacteriota bacterium]